MNWKVLLVLLAVVIAYVLLGAVGFHYIERPREESKKAELLALTAQFLAQHSSCLDSSNLTAFFSQVLDAYKAGYRLSSNGSVVAPAPKWDYPSAVYFCMTVITTIGYGNLSPATPGGQAFCCIYALIGIPLLAILLSGIAARVKALKERVQACQCWKDKGRLPEAVTTALYFIIGAVLFLLVPAGAFTALEGWTYTEGLYYSFVTLSTIGFGDYVAVQGLLERGTKNADAKIDPSDIPDDAEKVEDAATQATPETTDGVKLAVLT